ncbi:MAG: hypothetical protein LBV78_10405 [Kitasatospora sp.]|jgi:hypothetical protein|nr:hypothetical protein [Kitasatospora sp.]
MSRPASLAATALTLALLAGCGTATPPGSGPRVTAPPGGTPSLATSLGTAGDTWAVAVMGGSAASHNNFWQLFVRPAASTRWKLVTPPGVADNGGLVLAATSGRSLITGFRPSQYLTYTPLTTTGDSGRAWSPAGPLNGALANVPGALAAAPRTGRLLALPASGTAQLAAPGYTRWSTLTSQRALAATPPGRRCGLTRLTAAAFTPAGAPLLAGACSHPGTTGIFAAGNRTWRASGPRLPAALARQPITVIRLTRTANRLTALLKAGRGPAASLTAAWSADSGRRWVLSTPLPLHGATPSSASFGPAAAAAVILTGNRAQALTGAGAAWRALPALPPGTATLAPAAAGGFDALAVHRTRLTIWQLSPGATAWHATQAINVPIQFGSSG